MQGATRVAQPGLSQIMATIPDLPANDLSHPGWLRNALANPKRIWTSYNLLMQREEARTAARARSRETLGAESPEENPFSTWSAYVFLFFLSMRFCNLSSLEISCNCDHVVSLYCYRTLLDEERRIRRFSTESYDRNRVIVGNDPSRYVNASYVREGAGGRWWVAAEASNSLFLEDPYLCTMH